MIVGTMLYLQPWLRQQLGWTMAREAQRDGSAVEGTDTMVAPAAERVGAATVRASALLPGLPALFGGPGAARAAHGGRGGGAAAAQRARIPEVPRAPHRGLPRLLEARFFGGGHQERRFWRAGRTRGRRPEASGAFLGPRRAVCGHLSAPRLWSRAVGALDQCCPAGVEEGIVVARGELVGECEAERVDEVLGESGEVSEGNCSPAAGTRHPIDQRR